ncbi:MAG: methyl-accepting chemotaxis protein [Spirochaetes bacterium]|nr:methyl-accepting chemotaxis protein [Spirochaetota bacterium]
MKLLSKMGLSTAGFVLVSILTVGLIVYTNIRANFSEMTKEQVFAVSYRATLDISNFLGQFWHGIGATASILGNYEFVPAEGRRLYVTQILENMLQEHPSLLSAWSFWEPDALEGNDAAFAAVPGSNAQGRFAPLLHRAAFSNVTVAVIDGLGAERASYLAEVRAAGERRLMEPRTLTVGGQTVLATSVAAPIRNQAGAVVGIVGVDIPVEELHDVVQEVGFYPPSTTYKFSPQGTAVSHSNPAMLGSALTDGQSSRMLGHIQEMTAQVQQGNQFYFTYDDSYFFAVPVWLEDSVPWILKKEIPVSVAYEPMFAMIRTMAIAAFLALLAVLAASILLSNRIIIKPVVNVADSLREIATGEGDLTHSVSHTASDETGLLAKFFNTTIEKIARLVKNIRKEADELSKVAVSLAADVNETKQASIETAADVRVIRKMVDDQNKSLDTVSVGLTTLVENIAKVSGYVDKQGESVSQSSSAIEEMLANVNSVTENLVKNSGNVKELANASDAGRAGLQEMAADIREIARESEGLLEINAVMENIASQTNLLSMNAAIEAARAGESGKGFAVVAGEVRKLAESASKQSQTIGEVLKKIKASIDKITGSNQMVFGRFESIDLGVKTVSNQELEIRHAMEEQSHGSRQILQAIAELNSITRQVKEATEDMNGASGKMINESRNLDSITREVIHYVTKIDEDTDRIEVAVNHITETAHQNEDSISRLVGEVSKFKVN